MGYLAPAMVNYLALLGWNDGSEDEIFTVDQISKFFLSVSIIHDQPSQFYSIRECLSFIVNPSRSKETDLSKCFTFRYGKLLSSRRREFTDVVSSFWQSRSFRLTV